MKMLDLAQLKDQALTPEQTEHCVGGSGGKIGVIDLEGM